MSTPYRLSAESFVGRLLQDVMADASRAQWLKRAEQFEAARPRLGEFYGQSSPEQLRERWLALTEVARACRARAEVCAPHEFARDVENVLTEREAS